MTKKQRNKMFAMEGMVYAGGAWIFTMTAGLGMTYCFYQSMNYNGAPFKIPVLPLITAFLLTFSLCIIVPVITYRKIENDRTIIERMKGIE